MPRPAKINREIIDTIVTLIENGTPRDHAARAVGIHPATLFDWLKRGDLENDQAEPVNPDTLTRRQLVDLARARQVEHPNTATKIQIADAINTAPLSLYSEFADRIRAADSRFLVTALAAMQQTGGDDWRMWAALLAKRFPAEFGDVAAPDAPPAWAGSSDEAEAALERVNEIRVRMLPREAAG